MPNTDIAGNIERVREQIALASQKAGRRADEINLIAVTKFQPAELVNRALGAGIEHIGENRAQELVEKLPLLEGRERFKTHFIGTLQTNKVKYLVGVADIIESIDSARLLDETARRAKAFGIIQDILIEVNIGGEASKAGVSPEALESLVYHAASLPSIRVRGLMSIAPLGTGNEEARPYFSRMRKLLVDIGDKKYDNVFMEILSIGMSGDFEAAIMEGSTAVRIGTAIFGQRAANKEVL